MTAEVINNTPEVRGNTPEAPKGEAKCGNIMSLTSGPAALAALILFKIMEEYNHMTALNQEQQENMVKAQASETKGQVKGTKASGKAAMWGSIIAGATTLIGAGIAGVMSKAHNEYVSGKEVKAKGFSTEIENLKAYDEKLGVEPARDAVPFGDEGHPGVLEGDAQTSVNKRSYSERKPDKVPDPEITEIRNRREVHAQVKADIREEIELRKVKLQATKQDALDHSMATNVKQQAYGQLPSVANNVSQAYSQKAAKNADAQAQDGQTASSMAGQGGSTFGQNLDKTAQAAGNEAQIYTRMVQSGQARV